MPSLLIVASGPSMLREFFRPQVDHFKRLGWRVEALVGPERTAADEGIELVAFDRIHHVAWSRRPADLRNLVAVPPRVRRIVADGRYDIVHVHEPVAAFVTRYALRGHHRPPTVIYTAHGFHFHPAGSPLKNRIYLAIERLAARWTDFLVTLNREDEAAARAYHLLPDDRIVRVPGVGIDLAAYDPAGFSDEAVQRVRAQVGLTQTTAAFLVVARFDPGKRHADALTALAQFGSSDAVVLFAGEGPLETKLRTKASELGIAERVRFLGYRRDVPLLMKAAAAVILPSEREGLPKVVLEAMAMSAPVIATRIRGVRELLENQRGRMVEVGDTTALSTAMRHVLDDPGATQQMADRARAFVDRYRIERVLELHDELYATAMAEAVS